MAEKDLINDFPPEPKPGIAGDTVQLPPDPPPEPKTEPKP